MNPESVYFVSQIVAAVMVVISVLYLAAQVRSKNKMLESQGHYNALVPAQRPFGMIIENESRARISNIAKADASKLNADEWLRASAYIFMQIDSWEYLYCQSRENALTEQLWNGANASFSARANESAGWARFRNENRSAFDEPFASHVAAQIGKTDDESK
jgi:hypothetical protein